MNIDKTTLETCIKLRKSDGRSFFKKYPHLDKLLTDHDRISLMKELAEMGVKTMDQTKPFYFLIKLKKTGYPVY